MSGALLETWGVADSVALWSGGVHRPARTSGLSSRGVRPGVVSTEVESTLSRPRTLSGQGFTNSA